MAQATRKLDPLVEYELGWLGDDDPVAVLSATPERLRAIVADVPDDLMRRQPDPGSWSAMQLLGHFGDIELIHAERFRRILCEDRPSLVPFDPDAWNAKLEHNKKKADEHLALFEAIRVANIATWRNSSPEQHEREYVHGQRGVETYDLLFRMCAGHDRLHIAQLEDALRGARAAR